MKLCRILPDLILTVCVVLQEAGQVTLKVMSRPGRITMAGHIMTIVRNILGEDVANGVGKIRMLEESGEQVRISFDDHRPHVESSIQGLIYKVINKAILHGC